MKKRKNPNKLDFVPIQNPVAKFAHQFNKAHVFEEKNKYRRNAKHRKQEASPIALVRTIREASCFWTFLKSASNLKFNEGRFY